MKRRYGSCLLVSCLLILLSGNIVFSQLLPFRIHTRKQGMVGTTVTCLCRGSGGYLWVGTDNGLSRFDGIRFKNYRKEDGLPGNYISALLEDGAGNLWVATDGRGISRFHNGIFENFSTAHGLAGNRVFAIAQEENGVLWFAGASGVSRYKNNSFENFSYAHGLPSNMVLTVAVGEPPPGVARIWVGTRKGPAVFTGKGFMVPAAVSALADCRVYKLFPEKNGGLHFDTSKGLYLLDKEGLRRIPLPKGAKGPVTAMMRDNNGRSWIGTYASGLFLREGETISHYDTSSGLPHNSILAMLRDREGNSWFGTYQGLVLLTSPDMVSFTRDHGLPGGAIIALLRDRDNRLWIGTGNGPARFENGKFTVYSTKGVLPENSINHLALDGNGNIWIASAWGGIGILNPRSGALKHYGTEEGLSDNRVLMILARSDGSLCISTASGLEIFNNGKFEPFPVTVPGGAVLAMLEDRDNALWFSVNATLYRYSPPALHVCGHGTDKINHLFQAPGGDIWLGTEGGVRRLHKGKFTAYGLKDGLPDNTCYSITQDSNGRLWFGTGRGPACFDGCTFNTYAFPDAVPGTGECFAVCRGAGDSLWLGGSHGVTRFVPPDQTEGITPFIAIEAVEVRGKKTPLRDFRTRDLEPQDNYLRFHFVSPCFKQGVSYRYRLEGLDNRWHETRDRSVLYPYLPPRRYRFRVKAVNGDGVESAEEAAAAFTVPPTLWQNGWFRATLLAAFLLALALMVRRGILRQREKAEFRAQKNELAARNRQLVLSQRLELMGTLATGTVHDLKNLLSIILCYSRQSAPVPGEPAGSLDVIKETAETAVQMAKQILALSKLKTATVNDLVMSLDDTLSTLKISTPKNIEVSWEPPSEAVEFPIPPGLFQQVVMNLYMNAVQAMPLGGAVTVSLQNKENGDIHLEVADTGKGIEDADKGRIFEPFYTEGKEGEGTGLGLFVVKQIVEEYGGAIELESQPARGTRFTVIFRPRKTVEGTL
ncbi:MAG: hypothetical protein GY765_13525 [bacterium]|nr:hypothetical protein [bacterium]